MAQDPFQNEYGVGWTAPVYDAAEVTPNDSADLAKPCRALYVGGRGNMKIDTEAGTAITFSDLAAGSILPVRATRVYTTGTTATDIIALY